MGEGYSGGLDYLVRRLPSRPNHLTYVSKLLRTKKRKRKKNRNRFTEYITKNYIIYGISICCLYIADRVGLEKLTTEEKRWVEKEIVKGKRNGLHLR